jgi:segregation and condensation protein B
VQPELVETGELQRALEALLFVASEALSIKQLAKLTGAEEADVTLALQKIDEEFAHRGVVLREIAGGYRFASSPAAREAVEAYLMPPKTNLSAAALETLAIAAYMQPVTKGDIEGIRGVSADSVIATLVDRRFLIESGRKDVPGRPILYKTTPEFLEVFGLRSLEELPPIDVDAAAPIELALPIHPLAPRREAVPAAGQETPAAPAAVHRGETIRSETDERKNQQAPVETIVAEQETEPQPSAV